MYCFGDLFVFILFKFNMSTTEGKRKSGGDGNIKRKQRKSKKEEDDSGDSEFDGTSDIQEDFKDSKDDIDDLLADDSGLVCRFDFNSIHAFNSHR